MLLNSSEIKKSGLLEKAVDENYCAHSYDLTAGKIITLDNNVLEEFEIPPQSMAIVVSNETFNLKDKNIVGYTTVKNTLSRKGIMAVNVGLVDPGYVGPISSILLNFGKTSVLLKKGDSFLRMTFQKFTPLKKEDFPKGIQTIQLDYDTYVEQRKNEANTYLDSSFLYINVIKKRILKKASKIASKKAAVVIKDFKSRIGGLITYLSLIVSAVGLVAAAIYFYLNYKEQKIANQDALSNKTIIKKLDSLQEIVKSLESAKRPDVKIGK
ncbi:MAG: hypothetical protein V4577_27380 [Bacteroidota bacterium]